MYLGGTGTFINGRLASSLWLPALFRGCAVMGVTFGGVLVHQHTRVIDRSKLPSDGLAPLGIGAKVSTDEFSTIEQFEAFKRDASKREEGEQLVLWFHIPPALRCQLLDGCSAAELEDVANENARILSSQGRADPALNSAEEDEADEGFRRVGQVRRDTDLHGDLLRYSNAKVGEKRE
ncbi:MAG: hypothetical protein SGPRY_014634, partial [Prymnesium sp.]